MGGSPASGKSSFVKKYRPYLLTPNILKVDADEIRAQLPEYKGFNATQTHMETKDIVTTLISDRNIGVPCDFDMVYDGTMNNTKSYEPLIKLLKEHGYEVYIIYITNVDKETVWKRAKERYKKSSKKQKTQILNELCQVCTYNRKHAIKLLSRPVGPRPYIKRVGAPRKYSEAVSNKLAELWVISKSSKFPVWPVF
jgi:predicted ABC-type ATPase